MASLSLCTLAQVKVLLGLDSTSSDAVLTELIGLVSSRAERYCSREFLSGTYTERLDVDAGQQIFRVQRPPIASVTSLHIDPSWVFGDGTLQDASNYTVQDDCVFLSFLPSEGLKAMQIVYVGGLAADTASLVTSHTGLTQAIARQVVFTHRRDANMPNVSVSAEGGSSTLKDYKWLPDVKDVLNKYRRT